MSTAGYMVPLPPPGGPELRSLIEEQRSEMKAPDQRRFQMWAPTIPEWRGLFQQERDVEVAKSTGPEAERFNRTSRRSWWYGRDVDEMLVVYGYRARIPRDPPRWHVYFQQAQRMAVSAHAPTRLVSGASRSGSSGSGGRQRTVPTQGRPAASSSATAREAAPPHR